MFVTTAERRKDAAEIETLLDAAFGPKRQAKISYRYRRGVAAIPYLRLVVRDGGRIVGSIRYWPVTVGEADAPALLLGPLAIAPDRRGEGIGAALVHRTIEAAVRAGHRLVLLVGDTDYYGRFGFTPAAPHGIFMPDERPERLLLREIAAGGLAGVAGAVKPLRRRRAAA